MTAALAHELAPGQRRLDAQDRLARGAQSPDRGAPRADPGIAAPGRGATSPAARSEASPILLAPQGSQTDDGDGAKGDTTPIGPAPRPVVTLFDPTLALAADVLDDLERVKVSNENRLRQLTRSTEDSDGELRGFGLDESHPDVARLASLVPACKTGTGIADHLDGCACSPYRVVVDERRKHTAVTHPDWTPGHSLNDAMRVASKRLLRDLWREARRLHEVASDGGRS